MLTQAWLAPGATFMRASDVASAGLEGAAEGVEDEATAFDALS
jgi:hypothetical protein